MTDKPTWEPPEALKRSVAKTLYWREMERESHANAILSKAAGRAVTLDMEPFIEHEQLWLDDACAALLASPLPECVEVLRRFIEIQDGGIAIQADYDKASALLARLEGKDPAQ